MSPRLGQLSMLPLGVMASSVVAFCFRVERGAGRDWSMRLLAATLCVLSMLGCGRDERVPVATNVSHWQDYLTQLDGRPAVDGLAGESEGGILPPGTVGSANCVECHQEYAANYQATAHHRSGRWIADSANRQNGDLDVSVARRTFRAEWQDERLVHRERVRGVAGEKLSDVEFEMAFEVGSGTHAHSYLFQSNGFWVQSPLTWYRENKAWELSPGFDPTRQATFDRVVTEACVFCHVGRIRRHAHNPKRFDIVEASIGCERCHGAGEAHVAYHRNEAAGVGAAGLDSPTDVINPGQLGRAEQEAVCSQCHLQGVADVSGAGFDAWQCTPNEDRARLVTQYQPSGVEREFKIVGHVEQLHRSPCYLSSDTLTCITCHDPHTTPPTRAVYREFCIRCHDESACSIEQDIRVTRQNDDCSACHMPKRPTNVTHAALHDHTIGIHHESYRLAGVNVDPDKTIPEEDRSEAGLEPVSDVESLGASERRRRDALAFHSLAFRGVLPPSLQPLFPSAQLDLARLYQEGVRDPSVTVALAKGYFAEERFSTAKSLAQAALAQSEEGDFTYVAAADLMAQLALIEGDNTAATQWYKRLTKHRRVSGDFFLLGSCFANAGEFDSAIRSLENALAIDPLLLPAHEDIARIFRQEGVTERAETHEAMVRRLREMQTTPR